MGRDRGMGRKGEKQSINIISELRLKHRLLVWYCTQAKSVSMHKQRSPSWAAEGCWCLHSAPQTALHPCRCRVAICPQRRGGTMTPSNSFCPEVHTRVENRGGKTGREQGVGQRRMGQETKATCLKKWNSYSAVEQRYDNLDFITSLLV